MKWSANHADPKTLLRAHAALSERGPPPFPHGEACRVLFVPVIPNRVPADIARDCRLVDAAAVIDALESDSSR